MKVSKIRIKNFRLLKDIEIDLEDELSLIIGKNNCGKTSILTCLNKLLTSQSGTSLNFDDINLEFQGKLVDCILNSKSWNDEKNKGIEVYLYIEYNDLDNLANISTLMMDLDPKNYTVVLKVEYILDCDNFKILKKNIDEEFDQYKENSKSAIDKDKFIYRFLHLKHMKYFKQVYKAIHYDVNKSLIEENKFKIIEKKDLYKIISIKSIGARRDNINKDNDGTLSHLTSKYYDRIKGKEKDEVLREFENELLNTDGQLSKIYSKIFRKIINNVKQFGGVNTNDTLLEITSTLGQQELLKDNTTVVYKADNRQLPESYNGLGYLNLISIIIQIETILSEFRKDNETSNPADINLFFIEEPEAHTHPQMQYIFIKNIKELLNAEKINENGENIINLQTIITTHSSHIVSECDFDDIKYIKKEVNNGSISKNLKDLEIEYKKEEEDGVKKYKFLKQYLTLNRAEIFFADKAILFEGDTERILLPAMMKKIDLEDKDSTELPLKAQNISLLEVGNYSHIYGKFLEFIGIKTLIITDIDSCKKNNKDQEISKKNVSSDEVKNCEFTSNGSLKKYFKKLLNSDRKDELDILKKLNSSKKVLSLNDEKWESNVNGNIRVAYQINENIQNIEYYPRSFEDAFIYCNREFFKSNIKYMENNLKNKNLYKDKFIDQKTLASSVYSIANKCIESKASFAMDILLYSDEDFKNWNIPSYIKEGLEWLKK